MSYSKLHSSVVNSSLWTEPDQVRILFVTLLAVCDRDGCVYGTRLGLYRIANIPVPQEGDENPFDILLSPDPDSSDMIRSPEHEGRRIEEISGGFRLLNHAYYRGLRNDDDRREQNKLAQERFRNKNKPPSASVSHDNPPSSHTEAEADTDTDTVSQHLFSVFWDLYPRKVGKEKALKCWAKLKIEGANKAIAGLKLWNRAEQWNRDDGKFIPYASTFLAQKRYLDEPWNGAFEETEKRL